MTIHFICRGNTFRSIIAEAYLKSLNLKGISIISSGTVADEFKVANEINFQKVRALLKRHNLGKYTKPYHADQLTQERLDIGDLTVCLNQIVHDELSQSFVLPDQMVVWGVDDVGEGKRIPKNESEREAFLEEAFQEIVKHIDKLVMELDTKV
jgi:protein-tyrosine-phosphatase